MACTKLPSRYLTGKESDSQISIEVTPGDCRNPPNLQKDPIPHASCNQSAFEENGELANQQPDQMTNIPAKSDAENSSGQHSVSEMNALLDLLYRRRSHLLNQIESEERNLRHLLLEEMSITGVRPEESIGNTNSYISLSDVSAKSNKNASQSRRMSCIMTPFKWRAARRSRSAHDRVPENSNRSASFRYKELSNGSPASVSYKSAEDRGESIPKKLFKWWRQSGTNNKNTINDHAHFVSESKRRQSVVGVVLPLEESELSIKGRGSSLPPAERKNQCTCFHTTNHQTENSGRIFVRDMRTMNHSRMQELGRKAYLIGKAQLAKVVASQKSMDSNSSNQKVYPLNGDRLHSDWNTCTEQTRGKHPIPMHLVSIDPSECHSNSTGTRCLNSFQLTSPDPKCLTVYRVTSCPVQNGNFREKHSATKHEHASGTHNRTAKSNQLNGMDLKTSLCYSLERSNEIDNAIRNRSIVQNPVTVMQHHSAKQHLPSMELNGVGNCTNGLYTDSQTNKQAMTKLSEVNRKHFADYSQNNASVARDHNPYENRHAKQMFPINSRGAYEYIVHNLQTSSTPNQKNTNVCTSACFNDQNEVWKHLNGGPGGKMDRETRCIRVDCTRNGQPCQQQQHQHQHRHVKYCSSNPSADATIRINVRVPTNEQMNRPFSGHNYQTTNPTYMKLANPITNRSANKLRQTCCEKRTQPESARPSLMVLNSQRPNSNHIVLTSRGCGLDSSEQTVCRPTRLVDENGFIFQWVPRQQ